MSTPATASRLGFALGPDHVSFEVDESLYPSDALDGACYVFLDRCFVHLSRAASGGVLVRLTAAQDAAPAALDALAGEFTNELLSQAARLRLSDSTARIREYYTAAAVRASSTAPIVDELLAELDAGELLEDPLEIMAPWEAKQGAKPDGDEPS